MDSVYKFWYLISFSQEEHILQIICKNSRRIADEDSWSRHGGGGDDEVAGHDPLRCRLMLSAGLLTGELGTPAVLRAIPSLLHSEAFEVFSASLTLFCFFRCLISLISQPSLFPWPSRSSIQFCRYERLVYSGCQAYPVSRSTSRITDFTEGLFQTPAAR